MPQEYRRPPIRQDDDSQPLAWVSVSGLGLTRNRCKLAIMGEKNAAARVAPWMEIEAGVRSLEIGRRQAVVPQWPCGFADEGIPTRRMSGRTGANIMAVSVPLSGVGPSSEGAAETRGLRTANRELRTANREP